MNLLDIYNTKPLRFRSAAWSEGRHVEYAGLNKPFRLYRHANSIMFWPWAPTPIDLGAEDYEVYLPVLPIVDDRNDNPNYAAFKDV
jgi:hypothetical protein